jgi:nucleotide-binding universal stress UspA family protein
MFNTLTHGASVVRMLKTGGYDMNGQICPVARMEKLLVATDGSIFSESAIREAINLARTCSSGLIVVSVIKTNPEFEDIVPEVFEKAEKEMREHLESTKIRASKEGIICEIVVHRGEEPFQDIVNDAARNQVDMIIMGTHGRTGLKRLMMGSVTAKVIGHAPCDILAVPLHARVKCKNILIATDGSRYSDAAASKAIGIAKRCGGSLIVISAALSDKEIILPDDDEEMIMAKDNVKRIVQLTEREGVRTEGLTAKGKPYEAIVETAKQKRADLIVVGSHGRTGLDRLLMGSVTERVIGHSESAVLVVKA